MPSAMAFIRHHHAVGQHVGRDVQDVLGQHVVAAAQQRQCRPAAIKTRLARGLAP